MDKWVRQQRKERSGESPKANALKMAYESRGRPKGGCFIVTKVAIIGAVNFRQTLWKCQIKQSLSRRGNCWDNAPMERFLEA